MAAVRLPFPGTEFGSCNEPCNHVNCKQTEDMSETECKYCHKKIGYETRFYILDGKVLVHASCHEETIEKEKKEQVAL